MQTRIAILALIMLLGTASATENPQVVLSTKLGDITVELDAEKAPLSTQNFIEYVEAGFYDNTIFHRVISHFMIQGGGMAADMVKKTTREPIKNEAKNGLKNIRGTIAMARTGAPHSATSQFFINVQNNPMLDMRPGNDGYAVFGKVISGMEVVDNIRFVATGVHQGRADVPLEPVTLISATIKTE